MRIIRFTTQYDPETGEPTLVRDESSGEQRCDWSGETWETVDGKPFARYDISYGNMDPHFGSGGEEYQFSEEYHIQMSRLLRGEYGGRYTIKQPHVYEAMRAFDPEEHRTFDIFLRTIRVHTARTLLEADDNDVDPYNLPGFAFAGPEAYDSQEAWETAWRDMKEEYDL